jgi:hypothetical protein
MACSDMQEADQVGRCLSELDTGCLITYLKAEDLLLNAPTGVVALVILATDDSVGILQRTLAWLRQRWPRCPIIVIGEAGCGQRERTAREGGAIFLTRPVAPEQWSAVLSHAFQLVRSLVSERAGRTHQAAEGTLATG